MRCMCLSCHGHIESLYFRRDPTSTLTMTSRPLTPDLCPPHCVWLLSERQKGHAGVCSCYFKLDPEAYKHQLLGYPHESRLPPPLYQLWFPHFSEIKGAWHVVFRVLDDRLLPPAFNYSCWSPISPQLWRLEHTHTDKELCKCMCHVLLAVIFVVLCCVVVTGSFSVECNTQRPLL